MYKFNDLSGKRFGKLTVTGQAGRTADRHILWECKCDCGGSAFCSGKDLASGHTRSCGCLQKETVSRNRLGGQQWQNRLGINATGGQMMYEELVKRLRDAAKMSEALAVLLPHSEGNATAKLYNEAADAVEELQQQVEHYHGCMNDWFEAAQEYKAEMPRWIPVTERLPETGADVLVMFPHNMAVASRDMGEWVVNSGDGWCTDVNISDDEKEPTHWMPLPEPPKEG